jgi:hypothetical protein
MNMIHESDKAALAIRYQDTYKALVKITKRLGVTMQAQLLEYAEGGSDTALVEAYFVLVEGMQKIHQASLILQGQGRAATASGKMGDNLTKIKKAFEATRQAAQNGN